MNFVKMSDVVHMAVANNVISPFESEDLKSYLEVLDLSLDGAADGGFGRNQIDWKLQLNFSHKFSQDIEKANSINKMMYRYLNVSDRNDVEQDPLFLTVLKYAIALLLPAGCGDGGDMDFHECVEAYCGPCGVCHWTGDADSGNRKEWCYCPPVDCAWQVYPDGRDYCRYTREHPRSDHGYGW